MAKAAQPVPPGFHTLNLHLTVSGCADYIDLLKRAFSAVELRRSPGPGGKLMHADVHIGDSMLMLNDDFPEVGGPPIAEGNWPLVLTLYVPDADVAWTQAIAAGCQVVMPLQDQFWGDRYGQVRDPAGFVWAIATHTRISRRKKSRRAPRRPSVAATPECGRVTVSSAAAVRAR